MAEQTIDVPPLGGVLDWEKRDYIASSDEGLPDWLVEVRGKHTDAVDEFERSAQFVFDTVAEVEDAARAHRRAIRDAVALSKPVPEREFDPEVAAAKTEVAEEDAQAARVELAAVVVEILSELRNRRDDLAPYFDGCSEALRRALQAGPEGLVQDAKDVLEAQLKRIESEPPIVDVDDPDNADLTKLGEQEVVNVNS